MPSFKEVNKLNKNNILINKCNTYCLVYIIIYIACYAYTSKSYIQVNIPKYNRGCCCANVAAYAYDQTKILNIAKFAVATNERNHTTWRVGGVGRVVIYTIPSFTDHTTAPPASLQELPPLSAAVVSLLLFASPADVFQLHLWQPSSTSCFCCSCSSEQSVKCKRSDNYLVEFRPQTVD